MSAKLEPTRPVFTRHALERMHSKRIHLRDVYLVLEHGSTWIEPGNRVLFGLNSATVNRLRQRGLRVGQAARLVVVTLAETLVLTAYLNDPRSSRVGGR
jgi:hypothetical protein